MADKDKSSDKTSSNSSQSTAPVEAPAEQSLEDSVAAGQEESKTGASENTSAQTAAETPRRPSFLSRLLHRGNLYLIIFILLLAAAGAIAYAAIKSTGKNNNPASATKASSLTDQQIAALKGTTTLVGDSQQTLDVQSSSVFEGQVLMRNNLEVAGTVKVGGPLNLSAVTVGGTSTFGQVNVGSNLSVAGNTTLQGQVVLQKSLSVAGTSSFGTLSVGQLNVSSLQLTSDLSVSHHIDTSGGVPGKANGDALGAGGTVSVSGSDTAGTITINTGSSPAAGTFVSLSFSQKFSSTPHVVVAPIGASAAGLQYYVTRTNTGFALATASVPPADSSFSFDYIVIN